MIEIACKTQFRAIVPRGTGTQSQKITLNFAVLACAITLLPAKGYAQNASYLYEDTTILNPSIPEGFDTDRNVSVLAQPRPDYDPLGVRVSSFIFLPQINIDGGATNNVFLSPDSAKKSDGYLAIDPAFQLNSDWSRHQVQIAGSADIERYFTEPLRNQNSYTLKSNGRLDIGTNFNISFEADAGQQYESPYSGATSSTVAVFSHYTSSYLSTRGTYTDGQVRAIAAIDRSSFNFSPIDAEGTVSESQAYRDRDVVRESLQLEYAFTPSVSIYAQAAHDVTSYDTLLPDGDPNRSSNGFRVIGGINLDFASFLRGNISAGYVYRDFDSGTYKTVAGVSAEAKIEYFPNDLTTFTLKARRFLEDSSIGSNDPYFDNSISLRVDRELLRNLLLNASVEYHHAQYIGIPEVQSNYRLIVGGDYLASRNFGLRTSISYGKQTVTSLYGLGFTELRGQVGVFFKL